MGEMGPVQELIGQSGTKPRRRADAQLNHAKLLSSARAAVDDHGRDISLEDIALQAGVAIGTLYKHFPTRQHLLEAVFLDETNDLRARAEALVGEPGSLEVLASWLRLQLGFSERGRSMGAEVLSAKHIEGSEMYLANHAMQQAGSVLLKRAQEAGEVRPKIGIIEVLRLVYGIGMACDHAGDPRDAEKMFEIVIAGIAT